MQPYRVSKKVITETIYVAYGSTAHDAEEIVKRNWAAIRTVASLPERTEYETTEWGPEETYTIVSTDNSNRLVMHHVTAPTADIAQERWNALDHGKRLEFQSIMEGKFELTAVA